MKIWWCNQSRDWDKEYPHGVVRASDRVASLTYRKTVSEVKKGDIVVHYKKPYVIAISKAQEDGQYKESLPEGYESGWEFRTEYFLIEPPIHRNNFAKEVAEFSEKHYAINPNSNVKQGYFMSFDIRGLRVIAKQIEQTPSWLNVT